MHKVSKTWEMCPHCECEVELDFALAPQVCPSCGKWICPCSICTICIKDCEIEKECIKLNNN